mgnify:CR=1 FL=1|tara:strand:- start:169 stop:312 length:144 start_codon:yes stop_codon:yes gene_type:complete
MEFKKCFDGFIKITIPGIGVTWARDLEDAKIAIAEAIASANIKIKKI